MNVTFVMFRFSFSRWTIHEHIVYAKNNCSTNYLAKEYFSAVKGFFHFLISNLDNSMPDHQREHCSTRWIISFIITFSLLSIKSTWTFALCLCGALQFALSFLSALRLLLWKSYDPAWPSPLSEPYIWLTGLLTLHNLLNMIIG